MKVCLSQFRSSASVEANVRRHVEVSGDAAAAGCALVLFPELSLTGYEPTRARELALGVGDPRLQPLQDVCEAGEVIVACGAPLRGDGGVEIGLVVFDPGRGPMSYAKQLLHADEEAVFVPGARDLWIQAAGHRIAPGICFESVQPQHVANAARRGATVYAASVAKPADAIARAHDHYAAMARTYAIPIVVANAVGPNDGFVSGGRSAAWNAAGVRVASLGADAPGELVVEL